MRYYFEVSKILGWDIDRSPPFEIPALGVFSRGREGEKREQGMGGKRFLLISLTYRGYTHKRGRWTTAIYDFDSSTMGEHFS
jgi:hypothetical protein